ncbi:AraC family ligand binding domain-containing protein, partial [bacterium]|nr:AraC family ligand binding domain-containing protein [bacterium]
MEKDKIYEKISYPDISFPFVMRTLSIQSYSVPSSLRNHPEIEIQYIHQGSGFYFIKNKKYLLSKNTLLIIHPYEVHNFIPSSSSLYKTSIIFHPKIFSGKFAENIEKLLKFNSRHQIFLTEEEGNEIEIILRRMEKEFREKKKFWKEI